MNKKGNIIAKGDSLLAIEKIAKQSKIQSMRNVLQFKYKLNIP